MLPDNPARRDERGDDGLTGEAGSADAHEPPGSFRHHAGRAPVATGSPLLSRPAARLARALLYAGAVPILVLMHLAHRRRTRRRLVWGPVPIINNKYWSAAMAAAGWDSQTLMSGFYGAINRREDFDLYYDDLTRGIGPHAIARLLAPLLAHVYIARHAAVVHIPFSGGALGNTPLWRLEAFLYRLAGVRTVLLSYGADAYLYSQISDPAVRHALMLSYPDAGRNEAAIARRVRYWVRHGDVIVVGFTLEGIGRWEVATGSKLCIDLSVWKARTTYSSHDGRSGPVRILHAPNHRGVKGTEFLLDAVERLREEGLQIELVLVERKQNDEVRALMQQADVLADQFLLPGYGLAAIEGMASGLPVLANLDSESYTRIFRRHSFLDECPILSTTPESLRTNLRALVCDPQLRRTLGEAGPAYADKYHSFEAAQYLFGAIYAKLLDGKDVDLFNLFHPLKSEYNRRKPRVRHPLVDSRLPLDGARRQG